MEQVSDNELKNLLREGAKNGNKALLQQALSAGADLNVSLNQALTFSFLGKHLWNRDALGYRAIHWAARYGRVDIIEWLVQQGANIDQTNDVGNAALHVAIFYNQYQAVAKLLTLGANVNIANIKNKLYQANAETPLHYAVHYASENMVKLLRDYNADSNMQDGSGQTALMYAQAKNDDELIAALTLYIPSPHQTDRQDQGIKLDVLSEDKISELAKTFIKTHQLQEALQCYRELLKRNNKNVKALIGKGHVFRTQLEPQKAIACYEAALATNPDTEEALFNKAMALIELCKYTDAITLIQKLIADKREEGIRNYKDLGRYMQQHYSYLPPNLDLEDVARAFSQNQNQSQLVDSQPKVPSTVESFASNMPPPPPPPLPSPVLKKANETQTKPPLKKASPQPQAKSLSIVDILNEEMKKRFSKMNPDASKSAYQQSSHDTDSDDEQRRDNQFQ